jgi:hypothetical protein
VKLDISMWAAVLCGVILSAIIATPARSMSITSGTVACQAIGPPSTDIRHTENGTSSESTIAGPRLVTCSVPRSPLPFGSTSGTFTITGDNPNGATTAYCALTVFDYTGALIVQQAFPANTAHWVQSLPLSSALLPMWSYSSVTCALPEFSRGTVEGATAGSPTSLPGNINTNATECQATAWPQDALVHTEQGVRTAPESANPVNVMCALPRSPLATTATSGGAYVDGDNFNGASTQCFFAAYDFQGGYAGSVSFTSAAPSYDVFLSLPAAQLGPWNYTSIQCLMPAHGHGILRGITSVQ